MADKYTVVIKNTCDAYRTPSTSGVARATLKKGYTYKNTCTKTTVKTKKSKQVWYKLGDQMYVQEKNCKATLVHKDKPKSGGKKGGKKDVKPSKHKEKLKNPKELDKEIKKLVTDKQNTLASKIDGTMRLYGLPHQLTEKNDYRISSKTNLGTMFTETFILEAPIVYIKPGTTEFLPGASQTEKSNMVNAIIQASSSNGKSITKVLGTMKNTDWRYFEFKSKFSEYSRNVKMLCAIGSVMLKLNKMKVPWVKDKNVTFGSYDWSDYRFSSMYDISKAKFKPKDKRLSLRDFVPFIKKTISNLLNDDTYICFYIDASSGASESASNSTTQSILNQYTDMVSSLGSELSFVSGVSGLKIDKLVQGSAGKVDEGVKAIAKGDSDLATFLRRLTGTTNQLLKGDSFITPEIYDSSSYSKSYNITITLATPYGCKEAWFYNIFVPLIHLLVLALPVQTTANTTGSPFLVRAFSKGWFACDLGIIDSISIEKGGSGDAWTADGMAAEMKVTMTIKDLYATLTLPDNYSFKAFFGNTGLLDYLMVNCGIDITKHNLDLKIKMMVNLFKNNITSLITGFVDDKIEGFKEQLRNAFNLWK